MSEAPETFFMWAASEAILDAGYWSVKPPDGGGNPSTRLVTIPPPLSAALAHPHVAALVEALRFYAPHTLDGITFTGNHDGGTRARAALAAIMEAGE